jgi:hypothetical protein
MADYYTAESLRMQVEGVYSIATHSKEGDIPDNWERCPCKILNQCIAIKRESCLGWVTIRTIRPRVGNAVIEIVFFREKGRGYIRATNAKLWSLIEDRVIDLAKLRMESF